jgi:hypothetical protein
LRTDPEHSPAPSRTPRLGDSSIGYVVLHGWLTNNDKVIDVSLPQPREGRLRGEPRQAFGEFSDRSYFGVVFDRTYVRERRLATGSFGSLLDDMEHGTRCCGGGDTTR